MLEENLGLFQVGYGTNTRDSIPCRIVARDDAKPIVNSSLEHTFLRFDMILTKVWLKHWEVFVWAQYSAHICTQHPQEPLCHLHVLYKKNSIFHYLELSRTTERQPSPYPRRQTLNLRCSWNPHPFLIVGKTASFHLAKRRFCTQSQNLRNCIWRVRGRYCAVLMLPSIASVFTTYMYMYLLCWYKAVRTK